MSEEKIVYHGPRDHVLEFFKIAAFGVLRGKQLLILSKKLVHRNLIFVCFHKRTTSSFLYAGYL